MTIEQKKEKLDSCAYDAAWSLVHAIESGELNRKAAAAFLKAYADRYGDENCRFRAEKLVGFGNDPDQRPRL